jgi:hypothetical protein
MQKFNMKKILILLCLIICFSCINQKEQIRYDYVKSEVVDKSQKALYLPIRVGKVTVPRLIPFYFLYCKNNNNSIPVEVDSDTYFKTNIGDTVTIQNIYKENKIIDRKLKID